MRIFDINWITQTAGPSPDNNKRIELFLKGCSRAEQGNPCPGCFNPDLWDSSAEKEHTPESVAGQIARHAPNKYITIGGGEPTDQLGELIKLCRELKKRDFHIMVITYKELLEHLQELNPLLEYIDILVDGPYTPKEHIYVPDMIDGFYGTIGSGNQIVWDVNRNKGYESRKLAGLILERSNKLTYMVKENSKSIKLERRVA